LAVPLPPLLVLANGKVIKKINKVKNSFPLSLINNRRAKMRRKKIKFPLKVLESFEI